MLAALLLLTPDLSATLLAQLSRRAEAAHRGGVVRAEVPHVAADHHVAEAPHLVVVEAHVVVVAAAHLAAAEAREEALHAAPHAEAVEATKIEQGIVFLTVL